MTATGPPPPETPQHRAVEVLIVGAGQAGLGTGYWLARRTTASFLIVDASSQPGQSWCDRWDSLTLFTPRRFSGLPGLRFPKGQARYPTRTEMSAYLGQYARRFELPVQLDTRIETVEPAEGGGFLARTRGGGNSAAQLAVELAASHRVTVAAPQPLWYLPEEILGISLYWWIYVTGILNAGSNSSVGRYVRERGDAIIGRQLAHLVDQGTVRLLLSPVAAGHGRTLSLADGTRLTPSTVLWCTGYSWLDVPGALDADGAPLHQAGASPVPGLSWMGLPWQTRLNSSIADGVDRDAQALVDRLRTSTSTPHATPAARQTARPGVGR